MTMITVKTADLIGPALDWCVHQIEKDGWDVFVAEGHEGHYLVAVDADGWSSAAAEYSTDWSQGGPLIDEYKIELLHFGETYGGWNAQLSPGNSHYIDQGPGEGQGAGPTALIAACRAVVRAKLGYEVQVPAELVKE